MSNPSIDSFDKDINEEVNQIDKIQSEFEPIDEPLKETTE